MNRWKSLRSKLPRQGLASRAQRGVEAGAYESEYDALEVRRRQRLQSLFGTVDLQGAVLEVGPSHNPLAPKRLGYDTTIIDQSDEESLRQRYRKHPDLHLDLDRIEPVDIIWSDEPIEKLVAGRQFDWVIASHVAEHAPDLIGFLNDYSAVLSPGGRFGLVLPDKRFCFDVARPSSTLARVVDAHLDKHVRPSPGAIVEHVLYAKSLDGQIAWVESPAGELARVHTDDEARAYLERAMTDEYIDVHVWCFEPHEFGALLTQLETLELTSVEVDRLTEGPFGEFYVALTGRTGG